MQKSNLKCEVVGDGAVGKTSLLISYTSNNFPGEYVPTTFESYATNIRIEGQVVSLSILDTPGQEDFDEQRATTYNDVDVFIVCFAVDNVISYDNVKSKWYPEIRKYCPKTPLVLVGMKKDLRNSIDSQQLGFEARKLVSYQEGLALSSEIQAIKYLECSSLDREGLDEIFKESIVAFQQDQTKPVRECCIL